MAIQPSSSSASVIERAVNLNFWLFVAYVGILVLAAVLTWLVWHSGNKVQSAIRVDAEAKIAASVALAENARRVAAEAVRGTAEANLRIETESKERVKAELELERLRKQVGPRQLDRDAFQKALTGQPKAPVQILYLRDDADSLEFAQEIENQLRRAGWTVTTREPIPTPAAGSDIPIPMSVGGQPSGVTVVTHSVSEEEEHAWMNRATGKDWVKTPWTVLFNAFSDSMGKANGSGNRTCPAGMLRVVVAPRR